MVIRFATDGSSLANGTALQAGGWAYKSMDRDDINGYGGVVGATNNQMEITAAIKALEGCIQLAQKGDTVEIYSDSAYLVDCFNDNWIGNWMKNGWLTIQNTPVKNREYWQKIYNLLNILKLQDIEVKFVKVLGHSGNYDNEFVDKLAKKGAAEAMESGVNGSSYSTGV